MLRKYIYAQQERISGPGGNPIPNPEAQLLSALVMAAKPVNSLLKSLKHCCILSQSSGGIKKAGF